VKTIALPVALAAVLFSGASAPTLADSHETRINANIESSIRGWLNSAEIMAAVDQQNIDHLDITAAEIERADQRWRKEKSRGGGSLISAIMGNQFSEYLRGIKVASGGVITEIFAMDNVAPSVGQTVGTGDYTQGDDDKRQKT